MSSIFLWKGCCVGVAADTETVDELCMIVRVVSFATADALELTMVKRGAQQASADVHQ
jgi:hypothetical protein